jgi:hypothetical protein
MANELLIKDLQAQIKAGQVVAIVGPGVSVGTTNGNQLASWTGLLEDGVQRCCELMRGLSSDWKERRLAEIHSGDMEELLSAAEIVSRKLGAPAGGEFRRWLRESVGSLEAQRGDVIQELEVSGVKIATTNYDGLIEELTSLPPITWMNAAKVERLIRGDDKGVLHLHGYWDEPESVVLGIRSYEMVMDDAHALNILRALQTVKTLLFVGFSSGLKDPNFGQLLRWTSTIFSQTEYRRFCLAKEDEVDALQKEHPPEERLFVLSFGRDDSDLAVFLRTLRTGPQTFPSLTVIKGKEFLIQNSLVSSITIPIPFQNLAPEYGRSALANAEHWKRVHTLAEKSVRNFREIHLRLLAYVTRGKPCDKEKASGVLLVERENFIEFWQIVRNFPEAVRDAQPIDLVYKVSKCFDVMIKGLTYHRKDTRFRDNIRLVGWICDWLFVCLRRADAVLELYFAPQRDHEST